MMRTMSTANYNVYSDAQKQAKALADKGRIFALFLRVHYRDVTPEAGSAGSSTSKGKKTRKRAAASAVVVADQVSSTRKGSAPCWLPSEILQLIMLQLGSVTLADVLEERQRGLHVVKLTDFGKLYEVRDHAAFLVGPIRVRKGFPSTGEQDDGFKWREQTSYRAFEGKLLIEVQQMIQNPPGQGYLTWNVDVDLKLVTVNESQDIEFPVKAFSVHTNAELWKNHPLFTPACLEKMLAFRLRGVMRKSGDIDFFEADRSDDDASGLRFQAKAAASYLTGMVLDAHGGLAVGDRVRIVKPYRAYEHFAKNQEGVIRGIALQSFVLFYVELAEEDAEISKQVVRAHARGKEAYPGQADHHIRCQRFHLELVAQADTGPQPGPASKARGRGPKRLAS
jgi:hypothetical protein